METTAGECTFRLKELSLYEKITHAHSSLTHDEVVFTLLEGNPKAVIRDSRGRIYSFYDLREMVVAVRDPGRYLRGEENGG